MFTGLVPVEGAVPIYSLLLLAMPVPTAAPPKALPQPPQPPPTRDFRFSRSGSVGPTISVTVTRGPEGPAAIRFHRRSNERGGPMTMHRADSAACPGGAELLAEAERLPFPSLDVPGLGLEPTTAIADGATYRLAANAIHRDGQAGLVMIESNVGSPLAVWIDRMLKTLEPCWRPAP